MRSLGRSNVAVLHSANGAIKSQPSTQDTWSCKTALNRRDGMLGACNDTEVDWEWRQTLPVRSGVQLNGST